MRYKIREAVAADGAELVRVTNAAFEVEKTFKCADRTSLEDVRRQIAQGGRFLVATDEQGAIRASILVENEGERAYFGMLAVEPSRQRSGLGRRMIAAAEEWGRARGCSYMEMCIIDLRADLPAYYHAQGYVDSREGAVTGCAMSDFTRPVRFRYMTKPLTAEARIGR